MPRWSARSSPPVGPIDGLTQSQRFFLRYVTIWRDKVRPEFADLLLKTDPHAPGRFRAMGPLTDMSGFAQAFACKAGDAMHRDAGRVGIW